MKAVALLVVYLGYGLVCYGLDHVTGNCTPIGCVFLGEFSGTKCGTGSVPCAKVGAAPTQPPGIRGTKVPGTSLPSGGSGLPATRGRYTAPAVPGFKVYGGSPGTFQTGPPKGGYTTKVPPSQVGG